MDDSPASGAILLRRPPVAKTKRRQELAKKLAVMVGEARAAIKRFESLDPNKFPTTPKWQAIKARAERLHQRTLMHILSLSTLCKIGNELAKDQYELEKANSATLATEVEPAPTSPRAREEALAEYGRAMELRPLPIPPEPDLGPGEDPVE